MKNSSPILTAWKENSTGDQAVAVCLILCGAKSWQSLKTDVEIHFSMLRSNRPQDAQEHSPKSPGCPSGADGRV